MGVLVQIRDVPEEAHRVLKARAAMAGVSLSEYLRAMLSSAAARPTAEELERRIAARGAVELHVSSAELIRELRDRGE
jgi:plasmid stability protein